MSDINYIGGRGPMCYRGLVGSWRTRDVRFSQADQCSRH